MLAKDRDGCRILARLPVCVGKRASVDNRLVHGFVMAIADAGYLDAERDDFVAA